MRCFRLLAFLWVCTGLQFVNSSFAQTPTPTIPPLPTVSGVPAGAVAGSFAVSDSGSATYQVALSVPPGTAGMAPSLSVTYDSGRGPGLMGPGWALGGLSSISRCPATIAQDGAARAVTLTNADKFCLDGQRLVLIAGVYGAAGSEYRTERESFARIIAQGQQGQGPESFLVFQKNGQQLEFGTSIDSRVVSAGRAEVLTWELSRVSDRLGNAYSVSYNTDANFGESYPARIDYTSNSAQGLAAYNSVRFVYVSNPLPASGYVGGVSFTNRVHLQTVQMFTGETKAREYRFWYNLPEAVTQELRFGGIQECDGSAVCLPPTYVYWTSNHANEPPTAALTSLNDFSPAQGYSDAASYEVATGDWDGDGRTDVARAYSGGHMFYTSSGTSVNPFVNMPFPNWTPSPPGRRYRFGPMFTGDFNGDGKTDVAVLYQGLFGACGNSQICLPFWGLNFYLSSGSTFYYTAQLGLYVSTLQHPTYQAWSSARNPILMGDWNGDGKTDVGYVGESGVQFWTLEGGQLQPLGGSSASDLPDFSVGQGYSDNSPYPIVMGDWNGDGLSDLARVYNQGMRFYVANGAGFSLYQDLPDFGLQQGYADDSVKPLITGDWNGDGKTDVARVGANSVKLYVSTGTGFAEHAQLNDFGAAQGFTNGNVYPLLVFDYNSDGTTDIGRVENNDIRFYTIKAGVFSAPISISQFGVSAGFSSSDAFPFFIGDWDGDGFTDLARVTATNVSFLRRTSSSGNLVGNIVDGVGKRVQISYAPLTSSSVYTKGAGASYPATELQQPLMVVSNIAQSNGIGGFSWNYYRYYWLRADLDGRGVSGFQRVEVYDYDTGLKSTTYFRQDYPFKGLPVLKEQRLSNGTIVSRKEEVWASIATAPGVYFPYSLQTTEDSRELNGEIFKSSRTTRIIDDWGNLIRMSTVLGDGSRESVVNSFQNDASRWLLGQLTRAVVTKSVGNQSSPDITRTTAFAYYPLTGLLESEVREPGVPGLEMTKSFQYDGFGNQISISTSAPGLSARTESSEYDSRGQFPIRQVNALGMSETKTFDLRHGVAASLTGPNGLTSQWTFDAFGRPLLETRPEGVQKRVLHFAVNPGAPANAVYFTRTDISGAPAEIIYFDKLGRELRREQQGFDGRWVRADRVYDARGNLTQVSDPFFENETPQWHVYQYDVLGRQTRYTAPGNRVASVSYNGLTISTTNFRGQTGIQVLDMQGHPIRVTDNLGSLLTYRYDATGNPVEIGDSQGNWTEIQYDSRGKKTRLEDPDAGTSLYSYNAFEELVSETNARGQITRYSYDALGRLVRRESPEGAERWIFDSATHGIGKLGQVIGLDNYAETFEYDPLGRMVADRKFVAGANYQMLQSYDFLGRLDRVTYPSGFSVRHDYAANGFLNRVRDAENATVYWELTARDARGNAVDQRLGNGLVIHKQYSPVTGFLSAIQTGAVQNLTFEFDSIGNLIRRADTRLGLSETFSYDGLNRLSSAQVGSSPAVSTQYDAIGNITFRSDVGAYTYGERGAGPHAVTRISGLLPNVYSYDSSGNRISSQTGNIQYSSAGRVTSISEGSSELRFSLEPSGDRVRERTYRNGGLISDKTYFGALFEHIKEGSISKDVHYIRGGESVVAVLTISSKATLGATIGSAQTALASLAVLDDTLGEGPVSPGASPTRVVQRTLRYLLHDHLGSIQTITNEVGSIVEVLSFDPWGKRRSPNTWMAAAGVVRSEIDRGFTGHEQLDEVSLVHMNGRVYDPTIGRFVSPDPFVQSALDAQALNRYSYASNNPLSFTDPSGYFLRGLFRALGRLIRRALPIALTVGVGFLTGTLLLNPTLFLNSAILCSTTFAPYGGALISGISAAGAGFASSLTGTLISGGGLREGLLGGVRGIPLSFLSGAVANGVGDVFENSSLGARALAHGVTGGALAAVGGGKFGSGFASSFAATFGGRGDPFATIVSGGTAAALAGGRFEDGALRGAFQYLYNDLAHEGTAAAGGHHERLVVIDSEGRRVAGIAFGYDANDSLGPWVDDIEDSIFSDGPRPLGAGSGRVYADFRVPPTKTLDYMFTTPEEDARIIEYFRTRLGDTGPYNVLGYSCQTFSRSEFHKIQNEINRARFDYQFLGGKIRAGAPNFAP